MLVSIRDRQTAIQVAQRCIYGHDQIRTFAPEAVEDVNTRPFALVKCGSLAEELISRYEEAGVTFRPVRIEQVRSRFPDAALSGVAAAFEVSDVSINTQLLYHKLYTGALQKGARVLLGATIESVEEYRARLLSKAGHRETIEARTFVYSAGYGSRALIRDLFGCELPLRYWKSHLVVTKRLGPVGLFFVDPGEAAMMHHSDASIIGLNEDAELSLEANYDVVERNVENLHRALTRLVPSWHTQGYLNPACVKVDLAVQSNSAQSLNIAIREVSDGHICVLRGKMTETPYLTDVLVGMVYDRWDNTLISLRPCDRFAANTRWQQDAV